LYWEKLDVAAVQRAAVDVDKLAEILNKYYYNRDLVKKHGENAAKWAKANCSLKVQQDKWIKQVKEVLNRE